MAWAEAELTEATAWAMAAPCSWAEVGWLAGAVAGGNSI